MTLKAARLLGRSEVLLRDLKNDFVLACEWLYYLAKLPVNYHRSYGLG